MKGDVIEDIALVMSVDDNVATALDDLQAGCELPTRGVDQDGSVTLAEDVSFGHKFALTTISSSEEVYKYDEVIGTAVADIEPGEWVHTHNCDSTRGRGDVDTDGEQTEDNS